MNALPPDARPDETSLRATLSLDGPWQFRHEGDAEGTWREARVPAPWQACFRDLAASYGRALYRRSLSVPAEWAGREVALCFGAVSDHAIIRVDGTEIGRHEGVLAGERDLLGAGDRVRDQDRAGAGGERGADVGADVADRFARAGFGVVEHRPESLPQETQRRMGLIHGGRKRGSDVYWCTLPAA